jgi:hypothetical protein
MGRAHVSCVANSATDTLTVTDGTNTVPIAPIYTYAAGNFNLKPGDRRRHRHGCDQPGGRREDLHHDRIAPPLSACGTSLSAESLIQQTGATFHRRHQPARVNFTTLSAGVRCSAIASR